MTTAELINDTGKRIYWAVTGDPRLDLSFMDEGKYPDPIYKGGCVASGNKASDGATTIESFKLADDANAKRLWLDQLNAYGMTDEQVEVYIGMPISEM